jgi:hypothetical protein
MNRGEALQELMKLLKSGREHEAVTFALKKWNIRYDRALVLIPRISPSVRKLVIDHIKKMNEMDYLLWLDGFIPQKQKTIKKVRLEAYAEKERDGRTKASLK